MAAPPAENPLEVANAIDPETDAAARSLRAALTPVIDEPTDMVSIFISSVRSVDYYLGGVVTWEELYTDAEAGTEYLLRSLAGLAIPHRLVEFPRDLGRRRAEQAVPLDQLIAAIRSGLSNIWAQVLGTSFASPEDMRLLPQMAAIVWRQSQLYESQVEEGYLRAVARTGAASRERTRLLQLLIASGGRDRRVSHATALALGIDHAAPIVAVTTAPHNVLRVQAALEGAEGVTEPHFALEHDQSLTMIVAHGDSAAVAVAVADIGCGVSPVVHGVDAIPRAIRMSATLHRALRRDDTGTVTIMDGWPAVVASEAEEIASAITGDVLGPFDTLHPHERAQLLRTIFAFAETGSVVDASRELFCHRNTVLNRLRRVVDLTGFDLTVPNDAMQLLGALRMRAALRATG